MSGALQGTFLVNVIDVSPRPFHVKTSLLYLHLDSARTILFMRASGC